MSTRILAAFVTVSTILLVLLISTNSAPVTAQESGSTERVSVASSGTEGNNHSEDPSISSDGRYVAFESRASNLVSGDTNGNRDIFVHDRQTGQTSRISVASDGTQGNGDSHLPSISADGRYVAFRSNASNLISGDSNASQDVFLRDRQLGQTTRVSVASDGTQGNGDSSFPFISEDGRYVTFSSFANNLISNDINGTKDIFVHDRQTSQTSCVSVASNGTQGNGDSRAPSISTDGRYVAFKSDSSNLVSGDTNGVEDVFVHDRQTGQTSRVSKATNGAQGNGASLEPTISADGNYVTFRSEASNLVSNDINGISDIFVHDRQSGQTTRVSVTSDGNQGNGTSQYPSISANGRYVAFASDASNLVSGDTNGKTDAFFHDRQTGQTTRVSVASDGTQGSAELDWLAISSTDGRYVAFPSSATNLVSGDNNGKRDVFVRDRGESGGGNPPTGNIYLPLILKPIPTKLFVFNDNTGAALEFVVRMVESKIEITRCTVPNNITKLCGSFPPGTYEIQAFTACPGPNKNPIAIKTYSSGDQIQSVFCLL